MEILRPALVALVEHARSGVPNEACGLLAGETSDRIEWAYCLANSEQSPSRFTIDPAEHFQALSDAESRGMKILGVFHSHVRAPAFPSATDVAESPGPDWAYMIVSLADPREAEVRAFYIRDRDVAEVEIEVV